MKRDWNQLNLRDAYKPVPEEFRDTVKQTAGSLGRPLEGEGEVKRNRFFTTFKNDEADLKLFPDGRAIINSVPSGDEAQKIFAKYIDR